MKKNLTLRIVLIAIFASLIAIGSWISIPITVPFTLQTLVIFILILTLNLRDSLICISLYILLGIIGVPVFSGFKSGLAAIMGPTGGYIIGFIFMPIVYFFSNKCFSKIIKKDFFVKIIGLILSTLICYIFGTIWFMTVYTSDITLTKTLLLCVIPFIIPDILKMLLAILISDRLSKIIKL